MSDWLPTLLSLGEPPQQQQQQQQQPEKAKQQDHLPSSLDGFNLGSSLRSQSSSPRSSILLEMYYASLGEFLFPEDVAAYRKGKYKLIEQKGFVLVIFGYYYCFLKIFIVHVFRDERCALV